MVAYHDRKYDTYCQHNNIVYAMFDRQQYLYFDDTIMLMHTIYQFTFDKHSQKYFDTGLILS